MLLRKRLKDAEVEIVAQLGETSLTLGDVVKMKKGDIIQLEIPERLNACVDEIPLMECRYGVQNGQYALKIERFIPPESVELAAAIEGAKK